MCGSNLKKVFMIWKSFRLQNSASWSPIHAFPQSESSGCAFVSSCPTLPCNSTYIMYSNTIAVGDPCEPLAVP